MGRSRTFLWNVTCDYDYTIWLFNAVIWLFNSCHVSKHIFVSAPPVATFKLYYGKSYPKYWSRHRFTLQTGYSSHNQTQSVATLHDQSLSSSVGEAKSCHVTQTPWPVCHVTSSYQLVFSCNTFVRDCTQTVRSSTSSTLHTSFHQVPDQFEQSKL